MSKKKDFPENFVAMVKLLTRSNGGIKSGGKPGVRICAEVGKKRVTYFRGRDACTTMEETYPEHKVYLHVVNKLLGDSITRIDEDATKRVMQILLMRKIISKANVHLMAANSKVKKWPERLMRTRDDVWDRDQYYIINYEEPDPYQSVKVALLIIIPLLLVMSPIWPLWIKIGIWYCLVFILVAIFIFTFLRMIIFIIVWIIGFDFWILPNIFDDTIPWSESFRPIYSWCKNYDDEGFLMMRALMLMSGYFIISEMSRTGWGLEDVVSPINDTLDWGVKKLSPPEAKGRYLPSIQEINDMEMTAEKENVEDSDFGEGKAKKAEEEKEEKEPEEVN